MNSCHDQNQFWSDFVSSQPVATQREIDMHYGHWIVHDNWVRNGQRILGRCRQTPETCMECCNRFVTVHRASNSVHRMWQIPGGNCGDKFIKSVDNSTVVMRNQYLELYSLYIRPQRINDANLITPSRSRYMGICDVQGQDQSASWNVRVTSEKCLQIGLKHWRGCCIFECDTDTHDNASIFHCATGHEAACSTGKSHWRLRHCVFGGS